MKSFAVIPAAGDSRRMGQPKLLMPWGDKCVIEKVLSAWNSSEVSHVVVVVRSDDQPLLARCKGTGIEVALVDAPTADMKASVQAGLAYISDQHSPSANDVWLVAPADLPQLSCEVINQALAAYRPESPQPVVPIQRGRRGHPALFPWSFVERVNALTESQGINALRTDSEISEVECRGATPRDIDTTEDYRRERSMERGA